MRRRDLLLPVAIAVTGVALGVARVAGAAPPSQMFGYAGMFVTDIGVTCPGFAPG